MQTPSEPANKSVPELYYVGVSFYARWLDKEWILNNGEHLTIAIDGSEHRVNVSEAKGRYVLRTALEFRSKEEAEGFAEKLVRGLKALALSKGIDGAVRIRTVHVSSDGRPAAPTNLHLSPFPHHLENFGKLLNEACNEVGDDLHAAIDSYNRSFFEELWRFALVHLITALELLAEPRERSEESRALIEKLREVVEASPDLPRSEKDRLDAGLCNLQRESIRTSIKVYLTDEGLADNNEISLIQKAYEERCGVAHGGVHDRDEKRVNDPEILISLRTLVRKALGYERNRRRAAPE